MLGVGALLADTLEDPPASLALGPGAAPTLALGTMSDAISTLRDGYTFDQPSIELGVVVDEGTPVPDVKVRISLSMLNRHGLVAGATGTGKTKTLQLMAEQISRAGVPVFAADIKGDLSGLAIPGEADPKLLERTEAIGQDFTPGGCPVEFYALGGEGVGVPLRATVHSFGPILLSKVLGLNATQESSLSLVFHYADTNNLLLLDLKDLTELLKYLVSDEGKADLADIGGLSKATVGVIQRQVTALAVQGGDQFFGEPEFDTADLLKVTADGHGLISLLELPNLQDRPALFSTFIMWLLADLFSALPEVGDLPQPKLVFFFDEAHLLFADASKAFLQAIEQTVRLIRSKGIGVFFVTQTPKDVPDSVLAQLGNRVQHALRAHTPNDAKALRATVATFPSSEYDLAEVLTSLRTGEAIVTVLSEDGAPTPVARTYLRAPQGQIGPSSEEVLQQVVSASPLAGRYAEAVDRESAYEMLRAPMEAAAKAVEEQELAEAEAEASAGRDGGRSRRTQEDRGGVVGQVVQSTAFKSMLRSAGTVIGREITRSIFGTGRRRRR